MAYEVYFKCDRCGKHEFIPSVFDYQEVLSTAEKMGWDVWFEEEDGTYSDLCPECAKKELSNNVK